MPEPAVRIEGLRELRRDMRRLGPDVDKQMAREIREAADKVRQRAAAAAPRRTGELAESLRVSVTTRGAAIYSRLPQAPVLHWGGTIEPRGASISFPRTEFISRAAEEHAEELLEDIGDSVERAAERLGWRR